MGLPGGVFASDYDIVSDTSKARRFGLHDPVDTEEMFLRMFSDFRRERIIPRFIKYGLEEYLEAKATAGFNAA